MAGRANPNGGAGVGVFCVAPIDEGGLDGVCEHGVAGAG